MQNPNDVFYLARYAHNQLAPLFEQAKAVEPSIQWSIEMTFADTRSVHTKQYRISVSSHWGRESMFQWAPGLVDKAAVDLLVAKVREDTDSLQLAHEMATV